MDIFILQHDKKRKELKIMVNTNNLCMFEGRMVREPQITNVQIGQDSVEKAMFTIAVERALSSAQRQKSKNGDKSIKTSDFIPCSLLGAQVATLKQYFPQGKGIKVVGHYTEYQSTDSNGATKYGHIFEIDNIGFTTQDSKNLQQNNGYQATPQQNNYQQNQNYQQNTYQQPQQRQQPAQNNGFAMFDESDSPF